MSRKRLLWQILPTYLVIVAISLAAAKLTSIVIAAAIAVVLAVAAGLYLSRKISKPLEEIKLGADRMAQGDLNTKLSVPEYEELAVVAEAMNQMAKELDERIAMLMRQRQEQEIIVSSMVEGVFAVDSNELLLSLNHAAAKFLGVNGDVVVGRPIQEIVRNADLQRIVTRTLSANEPVEGDITLHEDGERYLQANGTLLKDANGVGIGALIVLNDVTRLRKLENLRRDFVANVSHELKTPITSIKGFVETLLDGASKNPEDTERFLNIVSRQANRLHSIIEDLLKLSRVEQESDRGEIQLERGRVREVLVSAISACEQSAKIKNITVSLSCDDRLQARINSPLLEQAIVNLVDNAIKYSESDREVKVSVREAEKTLTIAVQDSGQGIESEHLPRLFERFYRVDKARSRAQGGTGLGLAIVKHIVLSHGGNVSVESTPGVGSTFFVTLPKF